MHQAHGTREADFGRPHADEFPPYPAGLRLGGRKVVIRTLDAGADKVGVNTAALSDPDLVARAADRFGSQCVVVAIDARRVVSPHPDPLPGGEGELRRGRGGTAPETPAFTGP